jgi:glycosyltransferase involved in cell wall biosynthesis
MNWICCQVGAREHYAIPRALRQAGRSVSLCTDFYAGAGTRWLASNSRSRALKALGSRHHSGLDGVEIESWNARSLFWEWQLRSNSDRYKGFATVGRHFAEAVRDSLRRRRDIDSNTAIFAYDTGALELFEYCRERGLKTILDQIDPNQVEFDRVREEEAKWPGWADPPLEIPGDYFERRTREWELADKIVVNSEFSKSALLVQGVPEEKLIVVPLAYEAPPEPGSTDQSSRASGDVLRVLWLGQVNLRKGIQYLVEAAHLLKDEPIHFDVVGPLKISEHAIRSVPSNLVFHGQSNRDQTADWYRQADLFVLPTLSDGFAITQLEAMAHGLPVLATPNCGQVVTHGDDGFIIPPGDAGSLASTLLEVIRDRVSLRMMGHRAVTTARGFGIGVLAEHLMGLERCLGDS